MEGVVITSYSIHYTKLYEHGMVGRDGTARLADDGRVRQIELPADVTNAPDHVVGILAQAVVGRAVALGTGPFVVHAQATPHIHHIDGGAQATQFGIEASTLADTTLDVANIGDLGAQVKMDQLQPLQFA